MPRLGFWRQIIYDSKEWIVGKEEAIAQMHTEELDRLVAGGKINEADRDRVSWIINTIVYPPTYPEDTRRKAARET